MLREKQPSMVKGLSRKYTKYCHKWLFSFSALIYIFTFSLTDMCHITYTLADKRELSTFLLWIKRKHLLYRAATAIVRGSLRQKLQGESMSGKSPSSFLQLLFSSEFPWFSEPKEIPPALSSRLCTWDVPCLTCALGRQCLRHAAPSLRALSPCCPHFPDTPNTQQRVRQAAKCPAPVLLRQEARNESSLGKLRAMEKMWERFRKSNKCLFLCNNSFMR